MMLLPTEREKELLKLSQDKKLSEKERQKIDQELINIGREKKKKSFFAM